jgi:hypothetical protein
MGASRGPCARHWQLDGREGRGGSHLLPQCSHGADAVGGPPGVFHPSGLCSSDSLPRGSLCGPLLLLSLGRWRRQWQRQQQRRGLCLCGGAQGSGKKSSGSGSLGAPDHRRKAFRPGPQVYSCQTTGKNALAALSVRKEENSGAAQAPRRHASLGTPGSKRGRPATPASWVEQRRGPGEWERILLQRLGRDGMGAPYPIERSSASLLFFFVLYVCVCKVFPRSLVPFPPPRPLGALLTC